MPRVWNKRDPGVPANAIYVGRPTKWGNPYSHQERSAASILVRTRAEAVERYRAWLLSCPELLAEARRVLRGHDLVCWCAPKACHADVLLELVNAETPETC